MPWTAYQTFLRQRADSGQLRDLRPVGPSRSGRIEQGGRLLLNFSSNDYLGLAHHPALIQRAIAWTRDWGTGSTASRLVCGNLELFDRVESRLARGKGAETALILNSGFQANATLLAALLDRSTLGHAPLVFTDRLNHASLHHGCQAAGAREIRYRHNDLDHLETLLVRHQGEPAPRFIVTESVFSMDGDRIDLPALLALKERFGAFLYLDEAHATGVLGADGFGLAAEHAARVDLIMGTFSKGLGGFGAYAACSRALRAYLVNHCSGLIYSTALPPGALGAMDAALELLPTLGEARARLLANAALVRDRLGAMGLNTGASTTQILPVILGEAVKALDTSRMLEEREAIRVVAIRPPTVPPGTARLRISLTAEHTEADLERLLTALARVAAPA
ncbi:MAG: 8-amino-7-oxononanoate synthase [Magnetococcales bacterium]|nr:8-amino-7-oxononanoate synthase [Magnetococcales bacterium]